MSPLKKEKIQTKIINKSNLYQVKNNEGNKKNMDILNEKK